MIVFKMEFDKTRLSSSTVHKNVPGVYNLGNGKSREWWVPGMFRI